MSFLSLGRLNFYESEDKNRGLIDDGGFRAKIISGPGYYYLGIIDILTKWSYVKAGERFWNSKVSILQINAFHYFSFLLVFIW